MMAKFYQLESQQKRKYKIKIIKLREREPQSKKQKRKGTYVIKENKQQDVRLKTTHINSHNK